MRVYTVWSTHQCCSALPSILGHTHTFPPCRLHSCCTEGDKPSAHTESPSSLPHTDTVRCSISRGYRSPLHTALLKKIHIKVIAAGTVLHEEQNLHVLQICKIPKPNLKWKEKLENNVIQLKLKNDKPIEQSGPVQFWLQVQVLVSVLYVPWPEHWSGHTALAISQLAPPQLGWQWHSP